MAIVENKAAARSYYEQVLNHGNMSAADAIFAPDIQFPLGNLSGADTVKDYIAAVRTAFPDVHFTVADLVAEGHSVSARWTLTGTQTGELRGKAPTGQSVSVPGITVFHVVNGKIRDGSPSIQHA